MLYCFSVYTQSSFLCFNFSERREKADSELIALSTADKLLKVCHFGFQPLFHLLRRPMRLLRRLNAWRNSFVFGG